MRASHVWVALQVAVESWLESVTNFKVVTPLIKDNPMSCKILMYMNYSRRRWDTCRVGIPRDKLTESTSDSNQFGG